MFKAMNDEQITFLRNRCWELCNGVTSVPAEVEDWAEKEGFGNEEEGYLVKYNGQYGYLYDEEYSHDEQTDEQEKKFALEKGLKSEIVLKEIEEKAKRLSEKVDSSVVVMVGKKTGFLERHELCLFFPIGTTGKQYEETLNTLRAL